METPEIMCEICSKLTIETTERRHWRHFESLLLLTMSRSRTLFWCFHNWLLTSKCWLGGKLLVNSLSRTDSSLKSINFSQDENFEYDEKFKPRKVSQSWQNKYAYDQNFCYSSCKPIEIIFKSCISKREFP